ncbi:MAG: ATP-dependent helicase [Lachnospiraceae bacterium]|nr:ATP-dependent helicase [Lachnospiraceae bacterium]
MSDTGKMECQKVCLSKMNEAQRQAVTHGEGPLLLVAGPGSGTTYTITNRILYLLEKGIRPEQILVITYTKEAALSMGNRFQKMSACASNVCYPVNFGTFHSVFYHILQESQVLKSNQLLRLSEKKTLILPILKAYGMSRQADAENQEAFWNSLNEDAVQILSAIGYYKNTMQISQAADRLPPKWRPCFEAVCEEYETAVRRTGRIDFDDMLYDCRKLLAENEKIRSHWQKRFSHILMDEFQDINPVQYEVVKLLSVSPYNLFAVGDDDQAIYGFRGSEPKCLKRFQEEFHARELLLDVNYRSRPDIVRASLAVIGENQNRFEKRLRAAGQEKNVPGVAQEKDNQGTNTALLYKDTETVTLRAFVDKEGEYSHLLQTLSACADKEESMAVLFRTNSSMQGFAARLKSAHIPYEMREKVSSIYEHFIAADIMAYLQVAHGKGNREQMLRIMNRPSRYISREAVREGIVNLKDIGAYYSRVSLPKKQKDAVLNVLMQLERQFCSIRKLSPLPAVSYILKAVGYERYLKEIGGTEGRQEWQEILEWLKEDAARFTGWEEWKLFQEEYTKALKQGGSWTGQASGGKRKQAEGREKSVCENHGKNSVHLLTVHGSKGLEFDKVWIPDCNEKNFPHGNMPDAESVEEERRIFYVAMTRAKKSLELFYLTGTKERPRQPSRFLHQLGEFLK